jgi:hypothetical protein
MTNGSKTDYVAVLRREWLVLLVPTIVCLVVAGFVARVAPGSHWVATDRYVVTQLAGSVVNDIKPDGLVAAASTPRVLRSAEASLDLDVGTLSGTVSSSIDKANADGVVISVVAPSKDEALRRARVIGPIAKKQALSPYAVYVSSEQKQATFLGNELASIREQIVALDAKAASAPATERGTYAVARASLEALVAGYGQNQIIAQQVVDTVNHAVDPVDEPVATQVATGGVKTSVVLKGLLVGLVIGFAVAAVREWLLSRSAA